MGLMSVDVKLKVQFYSFFKCTTDPNQNVNYKINCHLMTLIFRKDSSSCNNVELADISHLCRNIYNKCEIKIK
jgi:hypothetical protein